MSKRKVDTIRSNLSEQQLVAFENLLYFRPTAKEIYCHLRDQNIKVHYDTVCQWYRDFHPVGNKAKKENEMMLAYTGIDPLAVEEYAATRLLSLVHRMCELLDGISDDDLNKNFAVVFDKLPGYIHQLRNLASSLKETKRVVPQQETATAAAEEVIAELMITFKDTPFETALATASRGVRIKIAERYGV